MAPMLGAAFKPTPPKPSTPQGTGSSSIASPPYMRPLLKPTRSDPTLLSSYGDDQMMLMKPPYHHFAAHGANAMGALVAGKPPGGASGAAAGPQQNKQTTPASLTPDILAEVASLDLFNHKDVSFKLVDLGNACWVERHF